ncbi:MAG: flagellar hook protein FlgE [bacterium]
MGTSASAATVALNAGQQAMNIISNNFANANTPGFKSMLAEFETLPSQTVKGASAPTASQGGTNAMQIGLGSTIGAVSTSFAQGGLQTTNNTTDLAIENSENSFFVVRDKSGATASNYLYTRAGNFSFDADGNFVNPNGLVVQGWQADNSGNIDSSGVITDLVIPTGMRILANPTSEVEIDANLNSDVVIGSTHVTSVNIYDSLGDRTALYVSFTKQTVNSWSWGVSVASGAATGSGTVTFNTDGSLAGISGSAVTFNPVSGAATGQSIALDLGTVGNSDGLTNFAAANVSVSSTSSISQDGYEAGTLSNLNINEIGEIVGLFSNGINRNIAQVALASFNNTQGLQHESGNVFSETKNSGSPAVGAASEGGRGTVAPGTLEMSNAEYTALFPEMMNIQRFFQANSKVIVAYDEMSQSAINLKR